VRRYPRLYAIADAQFGDPVEIGRQLLAGGARLIQIRDKGAPARVLFEHVRRLLEHRPEGAAIIVNDRPDIALVTGAEGVHLGQTDLPARQARDLLGPRAILGLSTHTIEQAGQVQSSPCLDYIAAGPVFPTTSKLNADPVIGLDGLREICRLSTLPVVAIGGIRIEDVPKVIAAGARSVAVVSDLIGRGDVERRTREYLDLLTSIADC